MTHVKVILPTIEARQMINNFKYKSNTGKYTVPTTYRYIVNSNSVEYSILTIVI